MKRGVEFRILCLLATCLHLMVATLLAPDEEVLAGVADGSAPTTVGTAGDLAGLIESWEQSLNDKNIGKQAVPTLLETKVDTQLDIAAMKVVTPQTE